MAKTSIGWIAMIVVVVIGIGVIFVTMMRPSSSKTIDLTPFHLDRSTTAAERELGLGGRVSMTDDEGMLFLYDKPGIYPFWMKGMRFPIDIIWINDDRVVDVVTLPPPATESDDPATHIPLRLADTILEINAGLAKKLGIEVGARLILPKD